MKENFFLILFILISITFTKKDKKKKEPDPETPEFAVGYITLPFTLSENRIPVSSVKIGNPKQDIKVILDLGSTRTWISDQYYNSQKSSSYSSLDTIDSHRQYDFSYTSELCLESYSCPKDKTP